MVQCQFCQRQASHIYTRSGQSFQLCDRCFDRCQVQDAYEQRLPVLDRLATQGDYEIALSILQEIFDIYSSRDHDGWLENTILSHKALIFTEQGRYEKALNEYRIRAQKGFAESSEFLVNQLAIAHTLDQLGRLEEAILELERGLEAAQGSSIPTALSLFVQYTRIVEKQHQIVPVRYKPLLEDVVNYFGIKVPDDLLNDLSSLSPAIIAADSANREAQVRYEALQEYLRNVKKNTINPQNGADILQAYIDKEHVGYYRDMALKLMGRNITSRNP